MFLFPTDLFGLHRREKLGLNVILGMYLGGMMLVPEFVEIATTSEAFTILEYHEARNLWNDNFSDPVKCFCLKICRYADQ